MEEKFVDRNTTTRERDREGLIVLYPSTLHHARGCSQNQDHPIPWISTNIHTNTKFRVKECRDSSLNSFESRWRISEITCFCHMLQRSKACWKRSRLYPQQFPFYDVKNEATFVKKKDSVHSVTAERFE